MTPPTDPGGLSPGSAQPPTTYQVRAVARAGAPGVVEAGSTTIELDTTWGGTPTGRPGPAELLAAAFASCLLKNLARSHGLLGFAYDEAQVEVTARRQDSPPKFTEIHYTLRITTDEPPRRVDLVHRNLRRYGTVYNTLAAVCDVHGEIVTGTATDPLRRGTD